MTPGATAAPEARRGVSAEVAGALGVVGVIGLAIMPLPAPALDFLIGLSICLSVVIFLLTLFVERPLDFSSFPSLLLLVTLFRLSLGVATTRTILLEGGSGTHAAGKVIEAFGQFAVGGNFVVGAVVFLILVIVNFIVITKGAERISEVSARFTLDKMPGKQMAIDADLGAGSITEVEARQRRKEIELEADFHGSMDGAAKFVRGDAIAGLLIVGINIVGGMIIGVAQHGMPFSDAAKTFTILSIGDGLVTQLPALLISTGSAVLATRGSTGAATLGSALSSQMLSRRAPLAAASGVVAVLGLVPGMPHLSFLALSGGLAFLASRASAGAKSARVEAITQAAAAKRERGVESPSSQKAEIEASLPVDLLAIEVGLDLLPLVDASRDGELLGRIASLRKQMALELGFIVPPVHVRDDLRLRPGGYRVLISGQKVAQGEVRVGRLLVIDPGGNSASGIQGESVREPTFGLPAKWIAPADRTRAETAGCTVVDPSAVVATHLTELVRRHGHELLGRREAQEIVDVAGKQHPKVIEELIPHLMSLGDVIKVLRNLLAESVSIRDMRTILETLADHAAQIKDTGELTEQVRQRLARAITLAHAGDSGELRAMVLDPRAEDLFRTGGRGSDPQALSRMTTALEDATKRAIERDEPAVLVVAPDVRRALAAVAQRHVPGLSVLSYREIDPAVPLVTRGVVATKEARA
ncbi:MAG: flagellar biosynthesis protein FlhA [Myxococcales bacterium]|nr:flagellar biosynthesis protein FlhA [Myxococcales bacterium]